MRRIVFSCLLMVTMSNLLAQEKSPLEKAIEAYQEYDSYDRKEYPLGLVTPERHQKDAAFYRELLEEVKAINSEGLSETDRISRELLEFVLQDRIAYVDFEGYLNPLLSDSGFHLNLNYRVRPIQNYAQAINYLRVLNAIPDFVDQHFDNLRAGLEKGVSQPKIIFKGYESTYNDHIVDNYADSFFYSPFFESAGATHAKTKGFYSYRGKEGHRRSGGAPIQADQGILRDRVPA